MQFIKSSTINMMILHLILLTTMLTTASYAGGWTAPKRIFKSKEYKPIKILSVYRDPTSSVNHVYYSAGRLHCYQALLDNGTELYNDVFNSGYHNTAVLRGAGDGKRLFLAYGHFKPEVVKFMESSDGGKSWSDPVSIVAESKDEYRTFTDMLYIEGNLFVFFIHMLDESHSEVATIKMVSRAAGSSVFSPERLIAKNAAWSREGLAASYERQGKKTCLHVAYNVGPDNKRLIWYTRSVDSGASWSNPREIKGTVMGCWITSPECCGWRCDHTVSPCGTSTSAYTSFTHSTALPAMP